MINYPLKFIEWLKKVAPPECDYSVGERDPFYNFIGSNRQPWMPITAVQAIYEKLPCTKSILEHGGGSSTLWLLQYSSAQVVTVEPDVTWMSMLKQKVAAIPWSSRWTPYTRDQDVPSEMHDLVIIDGDDRVRYFHKYLTCVRPGGSIVLDDYEHFEGVDAPYGWMKKVYTVPSHPRWLGTPRASDWEFHLRSTAVFTRPKTVGSPINFTPKCI